MLKLYSNNIYLVCSVWLSLEMCMKVCGKGVNDFHRSWGVHECMTLAKGHREKEGHCFCTVAVRSNDSYFRRLWAEMRLLYLHYLGCLCVYRAPNNGGQDDGADVCAFISTAVLWSVQIKALEDTEDEGKHISHSFCIS